MNFFLSFFDTHTSAGFSLRLVIVSCVINKLSLASIGATEDSMLNETIFDATWSILHWTFFALIDDAICYSENISLLINIVS